MHAFMICVLGVLLCVGSRRSWAQGEGEWRSNPTLARALKAFPRRPCRWQGTIRTQRVNVTAEERRKILANTERLKRGFTQHIGDPQLRQENMAKADRAARMQLDNTVVLSNFTLSLAEQGYVWQVVEEGQDRAFTIAYTPQSVDYGSFPLGNSHEPVSSSSKEMLSLTRTGAGGAGFVYEHLPYLLDLQRTGDAYEKAQVGYEGEKTIVTFQGLPEDPLRFYPVYPATRMTYDASASTVYPASVELLDTRRQPAAVDLSLTVSLQRTAGANHAVPGEFQIVTFGANHKVRTLTTVSVERLEENARIDLEALTTWPENTIVQDNRFSKDKPFQYKYRHDLTEAQIARQAQAFYAGTAGRRARDAKRKRPVALILVGVALASIAIFGWRR